MWAADRCTFSIRRCSLTLFAPRLCSPEPSLAVIARQRVSLECKAVTGQTGNVNHKTTTEYHLQGALTTSIDVGRIVIVDTRIPGRADARAPAAVAVDGACKAQSRQMTRLW